MSRGELVSTCLLVCQPAFQAKQLPCLCSIQICSFELQFTHILLVLELHKASSCLSSLTQVHRIVWQHSPDQKGLLQLHSQLQCRLMLWRMCRQLMKQSKLQLPGLLSI